MLSLVIAIAIFISSASAVGCGLNLLVLHSTRVHVSPNAELLLLQYCNSRSLSQMIDEEPLAAVAAC